MGQGLSDMGSHFPVLSAAVAITQGAVLELGCGHNSTPMLHQMTLAMGRRLVTVETDGDWLQQFLNMESDLHTLQHIQEDAWGRFPLEGRHWGVAFVDCKPGEYRKVAVERLKEHAQLIVVHDTETDYATGADYQLEPVFATFRHRVDYCRYRPYTTVLSMTQAFPVGECDRVWDPNSVENPSARPQ